MRTHSRATPSAVTALLLACLMLLGLTACSAADAGAGNSMPSTSHRIVVDAEGEEITVPEGPERVVALSEPTLDAMLALGVQPAGTVTGRGQSTVPNYLFEQAQNIPLLGGVAQPNLEAIGAVKPDLILVDGTSINNNPPVLEALASIAPVVYTGFAGGDWRDNLRIVAEALGMTDEGEQIIDDYEQKAASVQSELAAYSGETFSIVRWQGGAPSLILKELPAGRALDDLGLARPESQDRTGRGHSEPVSLENITEIDADYMFFGTLGGSSVDNPDAGGRVDLEGAEDALLDAIEVPGFDTLTAYDREQIVLVDGSVWTSTGGPLLMNRIIDDVATALVGAQ